ncbi:hypothetical protein GTQ40_17245 [Flavobacteriaceae bacterium R38]|nr:hypothetical protein [Flavobacteriaceae bacterium R38]
MKYGIILILILFCSNQKGEPKSIPSDLKKIGVSDFHEPDEILRIWRFPEGGAVFEELIEIKRNGKSSFPRLFISYPMTSKTDSNRFFVNVCESYKRFIKIYHIELDAGGKVIDWCKTDYETVIIY